jgi:hypothetical protein
MKLTHTCFALCHTTPGRLSYWEETEVNRQIQALIKFGKIKNSDSRYVCKVNLLIKRDGNKRLCGDYRPLNMQTKRDSFPMPLIDDVFSQMGSNQWFSALDLQSNF